MVQTPSNAPCAYQVGGGGGGGGGGKGVLLLIPMSWPCILVKLTLVRGFK